MLRRHPRSRRLPRLSQRQRRRRRGAPLRLLHQRWQQDVSTLPACLEDCRGCAKTTSGIVVVTLPRDPGALAGIDSQTPQLVCAIARDAGAAPPAHAAGAPPRAMHRRAEDGAVPAEPDPGTEVRSGSLTDPLSEHGSATSVVVLT